MTPGLPDPYSKTRTRVPAPGPASPAVLVYGTSRPMVSLLLYAVAAESVPLFHWLDVRSSSESLSEWDPAKLGWLDSRYSWVADPGVGLAPDNAPANAAIFELIRSDEPPEVLGKLTEFLRLPPTIQDILAAMSPAAGPNLLAVANVDRVSGAIPDAALGPILAAFASLRCSLMVGYAGPTPPRTGAFATVLRIEGGPPSAWREAQVHFEKGKVVEPARPGEGVLCSKLPFVERVFQRAVR